MTDSNLTAIRSNDAAAALPLLRILASLLITPTSKPYGADKIMLLVVLLPTGPTTALQRLGFPRVVLSNYTMHTMLIKNHDCTSRSGFYSMAEYPSLDGFT